MGGADNTTETPVEVPVEKTADEYTEAAAEALDDLGDEVQVVEDAQEATVAPITEAGDKKAEAEASAETAAEAAETALDSAAQGDINAANDAIEAANTDLAEADAALETANDAVKTANDELDKLLKANGLENVTAEDLDNLGKALTGEKDENGNPYTSDLLNSLSGNTYLAIYNANEAYKKAQADAEAAAQRQKAAADEVTRLQQEDLLTKIALQQDLVNSAAEIAKAENATDEEKLALAASEYELARLTYEYYLSTNVDGYKPGSLTLTKVTSVDGKELAESEYYYVASYKVVGEDGQETDATANINYSVSEDEDVQIVNKVITEGVEDTGNPNNIIGYNNDGQEAVPAKWETVDGKEYTKTDTTKTVDIDSNNEAAGFYAIDISSEPVVEGNVDSVETTTSKNGNTTTTVSYAAVEGTENTSYTYGEYQIHSEEDGYEQKTGPQNKSVVGFGIKDEVKNLVKQGYTVEVVYDGFFSKETVVIENMSDWDYFWNGLFSGLGFTHYSITTTNTIDDTTKPIMHSEDGVWETVTQNYVQTTTVVDSGKVESGTYGWLDGGEKAAKKAMKKEIESYREAGYTVTNERVSNVLGFASYSFEYTKTTTSTETVTKVVSNNQYAADKYTEYTAAQDAVAPTPIYGTKTTYDDGDNLQKTSDISTAAAKTTYTNAKAVADDNETVTAANDKATTFKGNIATVIGAIKEVVTGLQKIDPIEDSLGEIREKIASASTTVDDAVAKKQANDEAARRAAEAAANAGGYNYGGDTAAEETPTYAVATTTTTAEVVEADTTEITDEAVPAAGNTTNTRANRTNRTTRTANANADADADADATTIEDAETPLAGDTAEDVAEEKDEPVTIADEETAKAGGEKSNFFARTWWGWLLALIAVVAGTTAYAKKKANAKNPTKSNK
ncbi:MAG: hypothetical protein J6P79_05185 [Pseudobutyrivibrio sp.]|nr:hypothetical protein [Pseudobutyrivibrio sp.]